MYMTEISLIVRLNNQFNSTQLAMIFLSIVKENVIILNFEYLEVKGDFLKGHVCVVLSSEILQHCMFVYMN